MNQFLHLFFSALSFFVVSTHSTQVIAEQNKNNIIVLSLVSESSRLWPSAYNKGINDSLNNGQINDSLSFTGDLITANLYGALSNSSLLKEQLIAISKQFENRQIDYVTTSNRFIAKALDDLDDFLPFSKRILLTQDPSKREDYIEVSDESLTVNLGAHYEKSFGVMLSMANPDKVYVIGDTTLESTKSMSLLFQEQINNKYPLADISYLFTQDVSAIIDLLSTSPDNSAVYFLTKRRDSDNKNYRTIHSFRAIEKEVQHIPIFTYWGPIVSEGSVGGYVVSPEKWGRSLLNYIDSFERGEQPKPSSDDAFETIIDDKLTSLHDLNIQESLKPYRLINIQSGYLEKNVFKLTLYAIAIIISLIAISVFLFFRVRKQQNILIVARHKAELANEAKTQFLANMSHELRTPVNAILGITSVLKDSPDQSSESAAQLGLVHRSALNFTNMLNDVLDLNKVQSRELELAPEAFNLSQLCNDAVALFTPRAQAKGIDLNKAFDCDQWVFADSLRLRQIITNLLGNAIKFTDEGVVTFSCHVQSIESKVNLTLKIEDTGIGIAKEDLPTIFERFTQVDTSIARRFSGTGLGLAIVHELTELFGGQIQVESELGKGTCFTLNFEFDAADAVVADVTTPTETQPASENLTILVVDDVETNRMVASIILKKMGHTPLTAEGGKEAIGMLGNRDDIDLVLMDLQMPELDGYETTRLLRESGFSKPIIALSANAQEEVDEACLKAGMNGYASKPIDINGLQQVLDKLSPQLTTLA